MFGFWRRKDQENRGAGDRENYADNGDVTWTDAANETGYGADDADSMRRNDRSVGLARHLPFKVRAKSYYADGYAEPVSSGSTVNMADTDNASVDRKRSAARPVPRLTTPEPPKSFNHPHMNEGPSSRPSSLIGDLLRLAAAGLAAAFFGVMMMNPTAGRDVVRQIADANLLAATPLTDRECRAGASVLTADFTNYEDVLSVSPLGGVTAPGEVLPVPYIRVNTKNAGNPFSRRSAPVKAPATADIVAIERRLADSGDSEAPETTWTVHMAPCAGITVTYDRIDTIAPEILDKAGGLAAFSEIGGPQHLAKQTRIRVSAGMVLGEADGFDVALHDNTVDHQPLARPERYRRNPYAHAELFNVAPDLIAAINPDQSTAQCALDYLALPDRDAWSRKLGDAWGIRRAKGDNACRTALIDLPGTAQGAWFTDSAHNGNTVKVSAIALAPDTINPDRLVLALHGKLPSLTTAMIGVAGGKAGDETPAADIITFKKGSGRHNRPFDEIRDNALYCYDDLRVNFIGPRINGVILLKKSISNEPLASPRHGGDETLKIEARSDLLSCDQVDEAMALSDNATGFFR